jgi:hypothetical protein
MCESIKNVMENKVGEWWMLESLQFAFEWKIPMRNFLGKLWYSFLDWNKEEIPCCHGNRDSLKSAK